jgi:hypothetical protein
MTSNIILIEDFGNDRFYITQIFDNYHLGLQNTKMKIINTMWEGLTNNDIIEAIKAVLRDCFDNNEIEEEIEAYKNSDYFQIMKCNDEE